MRIHVTLSLNNSELISIIGILEGEIEAVMKVCEIFKKQGESQILEKLDEKLCQMSRYSDALLMAKEGTSCNIEDAMEAVQYVVKKLL